MKNKVLSIILIFCSQFLFSQNPADNNTTLINGYAQKVSGVDFNYHSSIPYAEECLLIRATDGTSSMEWQTAPLPADLKTENVSFIWLAGVGSSPGNASFDLEINGKNKFTFWADGATEFNLKTDDGYSLCFKKDLIDQHGDQFGFMYLTIPTNKLIPGESLKLKVTGGKFEKTSWYMTFKFPIESQLSIKSLPAIIKENDKYFQLGVAGILHFGEPTTAKIYIGDEPVKLMDVKFGYNYLRVQLPAVEIPTKLKYRLEIGEKNWSGELDLSPVRKWNVNLVQHSHTDIGYTRSQTDILAEHLRYIDYALDYCDITDNYPDAAKFRWTCEASWAVDEYLKCRPKEQIERLQKRIAEGRIEVTGMYFNFSDIPDEQVLAASLQPLKNFRENGINVTTAMQNDVNGIGWCMVDYYSDMGVKYLNMGTHGHRALICFDKPTLFWWESPSGKKILAYRGEHYMIGNVKFKIQSGDFNTFEDNLLTYLTNLEAKGYEYDLIALQYSGYITDNSPPSTISSDMIKQWNEKYEWPKLKSATASEFFVEMEENYGETFQVIRGAWPDWWTDGFGASTREVEATRYAQSDLIANTSGLTMAKIMGAELPAEISDRIESINSALLFYTEHTVGYHASVYEPFHEYTMQQRAIKESYAWEASRKAKMIGEETMGLLQSYFVREKEPSIIIFNTLNFNRSGLCKVYIDHQIIPRNSKFTITDQNGNMAKAQVFERHSDGTYWYLWVDDVPAFGYKKFIIKADKEVAEIVSKEQATKDEINELENDWYKIKINTQTGTISSIYDKELDRELVDAKAEWSFGEFIYELLDNRSQLESFNLTSYTREAPDSIWFDAFEKGNVWNTIRFKGNTRAAEKDGAFSVEIRLFKTTKRIDLAYYIEKKLVTDPEGIYIAFPFAIDDGQLAFDVQGGEVRPGIDQIKGSSNDWNTVQNYARLYNSDVQILLSSAEIPLMQFGGINTGRYDADAKPESTHIYGWPMNNYWTTNFNADQHGGIRWTYSISSLAENSITEATMFGWGNRTPFLTRVLPGGGSGDDLWQNSIISNWPEEVILISAITSEDGKSAIFHIRETGGKQKTFEIKNTETGKIMKCFEVDVTGTKIKDGTIEILPFESKFFRVEF